MASSSEAVKEMLVKKSADFSGRSDLYTFYKLTLGVNLASVYSYFYLFACFFVVVAVFFLLQDIQTTLLFH